jgi:hypothetical protein
MTNEKLTHWKKLTNPDYVGAWDFQPNQELKVVIESLTVERLKLFDGKALVEDDYTLVRFKDAKKPMILNKVNQKIITKVLDTPYIEQWIGKEITLYVAKVSAFGERVDAIRVKSNK